MKNDLYQTKTAGMFVTCILGEYDLVSEEIRWVNAGHQPALIRTQDGKYSEYISSSTPLGVIKHKDKSVYKLEKTKLSSSRFYVFTDGLSESLDKNGDEIGVEGSIKIIENNSNMKLYNYGKSERPNRKLGHITLTCDNKETLISTLSGLRDKI